MTNIDLQFPRQSLGVYDGIIGLFFRVIDNARSFFLDMERAGSVTSLAIDTQRKFGKNIVRPLLCLWHTGMTTHAFYVDLPIKMCIEILISRRQVPNPLLGIKGQWSLK